MVIQRTAKVLLVDDNAVIRESIRGLLESEPGWEVCGEAVNGREAIECAESLQPDVIVMDLVMPNVGGLQATREIVARNPQIPILIMTLHDFPELKKRAREAGARGFLGKSDFGARLIDVLRSLTGIQFMGGAAV